MNAKTLMTIGSILMIFSLFTPIGTVSAGFLSRSMSGYESDLVFSGILGIVLLLIGLTHKGTAGKRYAPLAAILGGIAMFNVFSLFIRLAGLTVSNTASMSIGMALPICGLGALLTFVASLTTLPDEKTLSSTSPTPTTPTNQQ